MFILKANAVQRSDHKEEVDDLLDRGVSLREIIRTLKHESKDFKDFSLTTLAKYAKQRQEENEMIALGLIDTGADDTINRIRAIECAVRNRGYSVNDAEVLDYIISKGLYDLVTGNRFGITKNDIFRAMDRKARILGPQYVGQTTWGQFDREDMFEVSLEKLWRILYRLIPSTLLVTILEQGLKEGLVSQDSYDEYQEINFGRNASIQDDE